MPGMDRLLPLLNRHRNTLPFPVFQHLLYGLRVTQDIVAAEEVKRRTGQRRIPEHVNTRVEVVRRLPFEHVEVKETGACHQALKTRGHGLTQTWSATKVHK